MRVAITVFVIWVLIVLAVTAIGISSSIRNLG